MQEQYGKLLPDLPEGPLASQGSAKVKEEEEKVLQMVGGKDSKGRPHGEVKCQKQVNDKMRFRRWKSIMPTVITSGGTACMESRKDWQVWSSRMETT